LANVETHMNTVNIVTHSGRFHADDIFAVAVLYLFLEHSDFPAWRNRDMAIKLIRTRDESKFSDADFVLDVGGIYDEENNRFDHHQSGGAGSRVNGIPYATFGLVWKKFGKHITGSQIVTDMIDAKLIQPTDAYDNGDQIFKTAIEHVEPYLIDDFFSSMLPTWKESADIIDTRFHELVDVARSILKQEIKHAQAKEEAGLLVNTVYATSTDKRIIVLDKYMPWQDVLTHYPEPLFVVYSVPQENRWHVHTVPDITTGELFKTRKDFPKSWAGKREEELAEITGVTDAVFCHNKLFLAVAKSKEGAIKLAELALTY
jgi:uncharacterized UPF0160 family protein